jgi:predicted helicase
LLNRLFGFELLMAPYAVAHLKLGMELQETGYSFGSDQRLGIYLTNTLEEAAKRSEKLFAQWISDEANAAASIKRDLPIMVVMGNPPYSGLSANMGAWIDGLLKGKLPSGEKVPSYYEIDGKPLGEKKVWLQDDYVKFLRFAQWRIERTGAGILAFVTNNGYLDNPTFRGMRQQMMIAFTDIYILNLHGSSKKKEKAPGSLEDRNVFDIQQGVAIGIFVKEVGKEGPAQIHHADLWGPREHKYEWLFEHDIPATTFKPLKPTSPFYFFVPHEEGARTEYDLWMKITELMQVNTAGIVSARDGFVFDFDESRLLERISDLRSNALSDEEIRNKYFEGKGSSKYPSGDTRGWKLPASREKVRSDKNWKNRMVPCLYRPFDTRALYYVPWMVDWPRPEVMGHMLSGQNLGLCTNREVNDEFRHALCTRQLVNDCTVSLATRERTYLFPLYLYPPADEENKRQTELKVRTTHWPPGRGGRRPNLNPQFVAEMEKRLGLKFVPEMPDVGADQRVRPREGASRQGGTPLQFGPEDVFNYMYAIFHSPTYRKRYAEFLKSDFPRVPLTSDVNLFRALCEKGAELVALHLLESPTLENPITGYPVKGSNVVEKGFPKYLAPGEPEPGTGKPLKAGRVYINTLTPDPSPKGRGEPVSDLQPSPSGRGCPPGRTGEGGATGQYFEGVPPEVWDFHIGGYQVCEKWLKDRRGRTLSFDDLTHYQKIITALKETMRLMAEIDAAIPKWPIE